MDEELVVPKGISWSGTLTLLGLWGIGPLVYFVKYLLKFMKKRGSAGQDTAVVAAPVVVDENKKKRQTMIATAVAKPARHARTSVFGLIELVEPDTAEELKEAEAVRRSEKRMYQEYLFSLVGYAIGLGNVWRFCYIVAQDGGSASLFAYILCTIFVATPLFMYELIIGQFLRLHSTAAWAFIKPRWQGLAISQFVMIVICQSYFVMVIGYTVVYMFGSCWDPLPWTVHHKGSEGYWYEDVLGLKETVEEAIETASLTDTSSNVTAIGNSNGYLFQDVDGLSLQWPLVGSLFFVYVVVFFATSFGKSVLADVTYVTVMAPVCLLWVLIIRTLFLPGAFDGLSFYLGKFELAKLGEAKVWANALSQSLFSMSPGFGTAITLSSVGGKHDDVYKAALVTSIANAAFAVCSGFAIFAMIGNIAYNTGEEVEVIASTGGQGLAFIVIASAMPTFGVAANALSAMFFFMLFTLGLDSSFCWAETITASIQGFLPVDKRPKTWVVTLVNCTFCFLIGLPYATNKGNVILDSVDFFVGINFLLVVCFVESIVMNFDFGWKRLEYALQKATHGVRTLRPIWKLCRLDFSFLIPISTIGLLLFQLVVNIFFEPYLPGYSGIEIVGWVLFAFCLSLMFIGIQNFTKDGSLLPIPDDYPYDGTLEERKEYWSKVGDDDDDDDDDGGNKGDCHSINSKEDSIGNSETRRLSSLNVVDFPNIADSKSTELEA